MTKFKRHPLYFVLALILIVVVVFFCTPRPLIQNSGEFQLEYVLIDTVDENGQLSTIDATDKLDPNTLALLLSKASIGRIPRKFAPYQVHNGDIQILGRISSDTNVTHYHLLLTNSNDPIYIVYNDAGSGGFNIRNGNELRAAIEALLNKNVSVL